MPERTGGRAGDAPLTILSPDLGGVKRAELLRQAVELVSTRPVGFAIVEKHRSGGVVGGSLFAGEVAGQDVWIVRAVAACHQRGARSVHLMATHAFCTGPQLQRLLDSSVSSITVTDTAAPIPLSAPDPRFRTLSIAPMVGQCLTRMHAGQPTSPVLDPTGLTE